MKNVILALVILAALLGTSCSQKAKKEQKGEKVTTVVNLNDDERMEWWRDASFGMFIHWGPYAVPGGERNGEVCGGGAEWIMDKLDYTIEDYEKEVVDQFNPVNFDADAWVSVAKDAGMKYIVITSKHHDGFCMWDSEISDYNIVKRTEFGRDVIKELAEACKKQDIVFCFYHSITDWHHPNAQSIFYPHYNVGQKDQTKSNPDFPKYFENYLKPQVKELLTNYGDVGVVWFDGEWISDYTTEMGKDMYKMIMELQPQTIVNNRVDKGRNGMEGMNVEGNFAGDFGTPEKEVPATGIASDWEACFTMNGSWGYKPSDKKWKSDLKLIQSFVDIVSKGGNFLLNVGPDGTGLFPQESIDILASMGKWNRVNGESVYAAKASPYDRPEWGRYTSKDGVIYAHVFDWPEDGKLVLNENINVKNASFLADTSIKVELEGKTIVLPKDAPDEFVTVIKLEL